MNPADHYETIAAMVSSRLKIQKSEFRALVFPVEQLESFHERLSAVEKEFHDASHHCWAYRLFAEGTPLVRSSDAGEPGGTAGRPIAAAIERADLHDVAVIVTRYFGGVKLGTGGLARAYRDSATGALAQAQRRTRYIYSRFVLDVPFPLLSTVYRTLAAPDVVLVSESFEERNELTLDVRRSREESFAAMLEELRIAFRIL